VDSGSPLLFGRNDEAKRILLQPVTIRLRAIGSLASLRSPT
jgi:hypothetical protein